MGGGNDDVDDDYKDVHLRAETVAGRSGQLQCCWSDSSHQEAGSFGPGKLFYF